MRGPNQRTRRAIVVSVVVAMLAATAGITAASSSEGGDSAAGDLTAQNLTARNNVFDAQVGVIFVADVGDNDIEAGEGAVYGQTGGTVAPGLNLAADGSLTGVPTEAGSFLFAYELANGGDTDRAFVRVDVAERSGSGEAVNARNNLFSGLVGLPFDADVADNDDTGDGPITFQFLHGALPPGVEFTDDGLLTGTPSEAGSYPFRYRVTDSDGDTDIAWVIATITEPTIAAVATNDDRFSTLVTAVVAASEAGDIDFLAAISDPHADLTVFAPTNDAFAALGDTLDAALADPAGLLTDVLAYHVLGESQAAAELLAAGTATTLLGNDVNIRIDSTGNVFINDSQVIVADIPTANGIIHVIDTVLIPPMDDPADPVDPILDDPTIAEIATGDDRFSTLVTAVVAASEAGDIDFLAAISDPDADLTVFAPTNDAFAALGDTLDAALADPAGLLTDVLAYHVLGESQAAAELLAAGTATTLLGDDVNIRIDSTGNVFINDSQVIVADIPAENGIVHVIDAVLLP